MKILILPENKFEVIKGKEPLPGVQYFLEDATKGTLAQGRAFYALIDELFKLGVSSYPHDSIEEFQGFIKRDFGAGYKLYVYADIVNGKVKTYVVDTIDAIPSYVDMGEVQGVLKSWTEYTKKERGEAIDRLIAFMDHLGIHSKKYYEILEGMERGRGGTADIYNG